METNTLLKQKSETKYDFCSSKKCLFTFILIILTIVGILCLWFLVFSYTSDETARDLIDENLDFLHDLILNEQIDATNLEKGQLLKLLTLHEPHGGLYRVQFDRYYNQTDEIIQNNMVGHCRVIETYATSYKNTKYQPFYDAMINGVETLLTEFYDDTYDGYFERISKQPNGQFMVVSDVKTSSGFIYGIKALSTVYKITMNATYLDKADHIFLLLVNNMTDQSNIGLYPSKVGNFSFSLDSTRTTNDMIHYFHALTMLYNAHHIALNSSHNTILSAEEIRNRTVLVWNFVMSLREYANFTLFNQTTKFFVIPHKYDENWIPFTPISMNTMIGRGFEWTTWGFQAMKWNAIDMNDENIWILHNIFNYSLYIGYDLETGALYRWLPERIANYTRRWVAVEALRSIAYYYFVLEFEQYGHIPYDLLDVFNKATRFYRDVHYDNIYGGLYEIPKRGDYSKDGIGWHVTLSIWDIFEWSDYK